MQWVLERRVRSPETPTTLTCTALLHALISARILRRIVNQQRIQEYDFCNAVDEPNQHSAGSATELLTQGDQRFDEQHENPPLSQNHFHEESFDHLDDLRPELDEALDEIRQEFRMSDIRFQATEVDTELTDDGRTRTKQVDRDLGESRDHAISRIHIFHRSNCHVFHSSHQDLFLAWLTSTKKKFFADVNQIYLDCPRCAYC